MEIRNAMLQLRRELGLTQVEFAEKVLVTRQAVSRWERGETVPSIDTLEWIAKTFGVPVDDLLGHPAGLCQSCGMKLERDEDCGTEQDGSRSGEYCAFCYQQGRFTREVTMGEMIENNLQYLDEWNRASGTQLTREQARKGLEEFLPTLKRWRGREGGA